MNEDDSQPPLLPTPQHYDDEEETLELKTPERHRKKKKSKPAAAVVVEETLQVSRTFEIGDVVQVAPRTWPGMNKLGGVGRINKINDDGTYGVTYIVLRGSERKVHPSFIEHAVLDAGPRPIKERDYFHEKFQLRPTTRKRNADAAATATTTIPAVVATKKTKQLKKLSAVEEEEELVFDQQQRVARPETIEDEALCVRPELNVLPLHPMQFDLLDPEHSLDCLEVKKEQDNADDAVVVVARTLQFDASPLRVAVDPSSQVVEEEKKPQVTEEEKKSQVTEEEKKPQVTEEEKKPKVTEEEKPQESVVEEKKPQESVVEEKPQEVVMEEKPQEVHVEEIAQCSSTTTTTTEVVEEEEEEVVEIVETPPRMPIAAAFIPPPLPVETPPRAPHRANTVAPLPLSTPTPTLVDLQAMERYALECEFEKEQTRLVARFQSARTTPPCSALQRSLFALNTRYFPSSTMTPLLPQAVVDVQAFRKLRDELWTMQHARALALYEKQQGNNMQAPPPPRVAVRCLAAFAAI